MSNTYTVEINHKGETHTIQVAPSQNILDVANDAGIDLPFSCSAGVCTTCAAKITNGGSVEQSDGMGVNLDLQKEGFALLCVAYPRSDLKIETEQEDAVYDRQFGKV